jgi:hypothetical protein
MRLKVYCTSFLSAAKTKKPQKTSAQNSIPFFSFSQLESTHGGGGGGGHLSAVR